LISPKRRYDSTDGNRVPKGSLVGSHGTRIAVPAIAVVAVTAALALIATAPLILFPKETDDIGAIAPPPAASGEVGRVTAPALEPERTVSRPAAPPGSAVAPAESAPLLVAFSPPASPRGELNVDRPTRTGDAGVERRVAREGDVARGKAKGHAKKGRETTGSQGKALGHLKDKARGNAYGHDKPGPPPALSPTTPHGPKPHHVDPPGAGKHSGRGARAHARAGR
jgi:hypothetical protein